MHTMTNPDIIIVGAGHNALVTATYLAKARKKVLVLEQREVAGGQLAAHSFGPGLDVAPLHAGANLRPGIVRDLDLARHGLATGASGVGPLSVSTGKAQLLGDTSN